MHDFEVPVDWAYTLAVWWGGERPWGWDGTAQRTDLEDRVPRGQRAAHGCLLAEERALEILPQVFWHLVLLSHGHFLLPAVPSLVMSPGTSSCED